MTGLTLLAVAIGLAMDAFAVSIATGLAVSKVTPRHTFRIAFHFGLFQFLMPVLGWLAGSELATRIGGWDHWIAFLLLVYVGGKMAWEAWNDDADQPNTKEDPTRGWSLVTLSVATSIDALAVGFSMALLGVSVWKPAFVIGLVTGASALAESPSAEGWEAAGAAGRKCSVHASSWQSAPGSCLPTSPAPSTTAPLRPQNPVGCRCPVANAHSSRQPQAVGEILKPSIAGIDQVPHRSLRRGCQMPLQ